MLTVEIANRQSLLEVNESQLRDAVTRILADTGCHSGEISVAIVDDAAIHVLNRQFLQHDYATDVLSFTLERVGDHIEGEVIVSAETAARQAAQYDWAASSELLLYVIHGTLHIIGLDDHEPADRAEMRCREREYLARYGFEPRDLV